MTPVTFDPTKFRTKQEKWGSHTVRHQTGGTVQIDEYDWRKAIKVHCTECMGFGDPKDCTDPLCALYRWRGRTYLTISQTPEDTE
jgi:hypothetical protein